MLYANQEGRCAICLTRLRNRFASPADKVGAVANVDHCHATEKTDGVRASVRGLLCGHCNHVFLGHSHDRADKFQRAFLYLTSPPARPLLRADDSGMSIPGEQKRDTRVFPLRGSAESPSSSADQPTTG
jgi:hypothetical protein